MVNGPLPGMRPAPSGGASSLDVVFRVPEARRAQSTPQFAVFAQILGKLNFFKLGENLYRILFDYVEKRANPANATFKRAC
jgi:hypothetical protein